MNNTAIVKIEATVADNTRMSSIFLDTNEFGRIYTLSNNYGLWTLSNKCNNKRQQAM